LYLLESQLSALDLHHYLQLFEPTLPLREILKAISRAKDELAGPEKYQQLAEQQRAQATTEDQVVAADKALEVARVYTVYQNHLDQQHLLDFGDLIMKSVLLLQEHPDVCDKIQRTFQEVLVDEYQDVNRASAIFLHLLVGAGEGLWVVGDPRQSIYRFRGASPLNILGFTTDFLDAQVLRLQRNYRSLPAVLETYAHLASQMDSASPEPFAKWEANRGESSGTVHFEIADTLDGECDGLAQMIQQNKSNGILYQDQAVLCRTHTVLGRIAERLEQAGIPVLYLGDLFERTEIRDLLALLMLASGGGHGLLRVARFREYAVPLEDVKALLAAAYERQIQFPDAFALVQTDLLLSDAGRAGLERLQQHLSGLVFGVTPWGLLVHYLLNRSQYLHPILADSTVPAQQQRLAIHQFLQFVYAQGRTASGPKAMRDFLENVRRLERWGDETQLRTLPVGADDIEAVRLLTVHASKGLEFKAVYMPYLGSGYFPLGKKPQPCPPPLGLLPDGHEHYHEDEEQSLFFVAMSRARDVLWLSRAERYGSRNSNASALLEKLVPILPRAPNGSVSLPSSVEPAAEVTHATPSATEPTGYDLDVLEVYLDCPRRYYYEYELDLIARRSDTAFLQFHRCVRDCIYWIQTEYAAGHAVTNPQAQTWLQAHWQTKGPVQHPYNDLYWEQALLMLNRALEGQAQAASIVVPVSIDLQLSSGTIRFTPSRILVTDDGTELIQRVRTGGSSSTERDSRIRAVYQAAAKARPGRPSQIQTVHLSTGEVDQVTLTDKKLASGLRKYEEAIRGIQEHQFDPDPSDHCPGCPYYFICPKAEDT
jgi:superfamily I DNA/RNA helicase